MERPVVDPHAGWSPPTPISGASDVDSGGVPVDAGVVAHPQASQVAGQAPACQSSHPPRKTGPLFLGRLCPRSLDSHFEEWRRALSASGVISIGYDPDPPHHVEEFGGGHSLDVASVTSPVDDPAEVEDVVVQPFPDRCHKLLVAEDGRLSGRLGHRLEGRFLGRPESPETAQATLLLRCSLSPSPFRFSQDAKGEPVIFRPGPTAGMPQIHHVVPQPYADVGNGFRGRRIRRAVDGTGQGSIPERDGTGQSGMERDKGDHPPASPAFRHSVSTAGRPAR